MAVMERTSDFKSGLWRFWIPKAVSAVVQYPTETQLISCNQDAISYNSR